MLYGTRMQTSNILPYILEVRPVSALDNPKALHQTHTKNSDRSSKISNKIINSESITFSNILQNEMNQVDQKEWRR